MRYPLDISLARSIQPHRILPLRKSDPHTLSPPLAYVPKDFLSTLPLSAWQEQGRSFCICCRSKENSNPLTLHVYRAPQKGRLAVLAPNEFPQKTLRPNA